jgi:hypothetical protein
MMGDERIRDVIEIDGLLHSRGRMAMIGTGIVLVGFSAAGALNLFSPHVLVDWIHPRHHFMIELISGTAFGLIQGFLWAGIFCMLAGMLSPLIVEGVDRMLALESARFLYFASILAMALRIAWFAAVPTFPVSDAEWFHERALAMAQRLGYIGPLGTPTAYWPIGYPLFLSLLYRIWPVQTIAQFANLGLSIAVLICTYRILYKRSSETVARITVLLLAVSLSEISYVNILYSETLFSVLALLALTLYLDSLERISVWSALAAGAFTGAAVLVRPVALLLPLVFVIILLRDDGARMKKVMIFSACCVAILIVLAPNIIRNYNVFHHFVPVSTNGGINFWIGNNPASNGGYGVPPALPSAGEVELDRAGYEQGVAWIVHNPGSAVVNCCKKFALLWLHDDQGVLSSYMGTRGPVSWGLEVAALILGNLFYLAALTLAITSVWKRRNSFTQMDYFFILLLLLWTAFHLAYFGADRFHFPMLPIIFYFAATGMSKPFNSGFEVNQSILAGTDSRGCGSV